MYPEDVELLRNAYAAFARRDFPALLDVLAPDIEWVEPAGADGIAGTHRGYEEVLRGVLHKVPACPDVFRVEPEEFLDAGDQVIVLGHHRGPAEGDGRSFAIPFAHVWTLSDGWAVRFRAYFDTAKFVEALANLG
jgi:uncharacterized protein